MKLIKITQHGFYKGIEEVKYLTFENFDKEVFVQLLQKFCPITTKEKCDEFIESYIGSGGYNCGRLLSGLGEVEMELVSESVEVLPDSTATEQK